MIAFVIVAFEDTLLISLLQFYWDMNLYELSFILYCSLDMFLNFLASHTHTHTERETETERDRRQTLIVVCPFPSTWSMVELTNNRVYEDAVLNPFSMLLYFFSTLYCFYLVLFHIIGDFLMGIL